METDKTDLDNTQKKMQENLPGMRQNLHELEMRLAWLRKQVSDLKTVVENQRGMILLAEQMTAQPIENIIGDKQDE